MSDDALELSALARLGIPAPGPVELRPGERTLDALAREGRLTRPQVLAARSWVARNAAACGCAQRWFRGEACPRCGQTVGLDASPAAELGSAARLGLGQRVGAIELQEELGRGVAGVVYRGYHAGLGRDVALKVVEGAADPRQRRRIQREVEALGRLSHPGIVAVHAVHELPKGVAIEMELVAGQTLGKQVAEGGALGWREAARLVAELARAVHYAHGEGVLHRDLKPENVLLRAQDGAPVIADFGVSRLTDQASSLTGAGAMVGTPLYMPPEAFHGEFGPAGDVYGLGSILYFLLSGRARFDDVQSAPELLRRIAGGQEKPVEVAGAPRGLTRVVAKALHVDATRRYPSAAALAEDLERLLRGEGASAASGGAAGPFPRGVLPALALAGIGVLAVWVARLATRPAPSPPPSVAPERSRVERALATLAASEGEARVRSSALARLSAAADPAHVDHEAVAAGLEQALAAEEGTPELHLLRARFDLAGGTSLRVADLSACAALEVRHVGELCLAAMERGTSPPLRTPSARAAARALYAAHPESSAAAWLLGVTLCAGGDPADCAQAAEVLVEPSARQAPRAYLAAKVLRAAGECRAFLEAREAPADGGAALVEGLEALRADPELEAAPAVVLALLREVVHEVILEAAALDLTQREVPLTVVRAFTAAGASLRPDQRALFALLIDGMDEAPAEYVAPSSAEFAAWSEALAATGDPLLGGVGLEVSIRYRLENEGPADPSELLALLGRARRSAALLGPLPADATTWADQRSMRSHHRLAVDRVQLHSKLAAAASDEAAREEALRTAREAALEALELVDRFGLSWRADIEPDAVIRLSLELGDLDAAANLASRSKAPCALEAELLRLRGRPRDALAAVEAALADPSTAAAEQADLRAVQALTLADVGQLDEARRVLLELGEAFLTDPEVLRELWLPSAVASQLER